MDHAFSVRGVSKKFMFYQQHNSLREELFSMFHARRKEEFFALRDISFDINKGEFFGIIGRNGSGKSTLLKILARIYPPDTGTVIHQGKISPFLELGVGFNGELSARENIFLNGTILGLRRKQIQERLEDIFEFAELRQFADMQLKHFSSGMYARLAFSLAIQVDADILIMDEVLAVGDESFREKCYQVFADLKKQGKTIILVSHLLDDISRFADRVLLMEKGRQVDIGQAEQIFEQYHQITHTDGIT